MLAEIQEVFVSVFLTGVEETAQCIQGNAVNIVALERSRMCVLSDMKDPLWSMTYVNAKNNILEKVATSTQATAFQAAPSATLPENVSSASVISFYHMVHVRPTKSYALLLVRDVSVLPDFASHVFEMPIELAMAHVRVIHIGQVPNASYIKDLDQENAWGEYHLRNVCTINLTN